MKKTLLIAIVAFGFSFASKAQTQPSAVNETKPAVVVTATDPVQTPTPVVSADTVVAVKKQCAGEGTSKCKSGSGKGCCKAKQGEASASTAPTSAATSTPAVQTGGTTPTTAHKCGSTGCCKKKATKSGS